MSLKLKIICAITVFYFVLLPSMIIHAQACGVATQTTAQLQWSLDSQLIYYSCDQNFIDEAWDWFDFNNSWNDDFGYSECCNIQLPLARTFNAMYLMRSVTWDWYDWTTDWIDDLRADCDTSSVATAYSGAFTSDRVELHRPFFYNQTAVDRAVTLVHEARHLTGKGHNADDDDCPNGGSCDSSWEYQGANYYAAIYCRDFYCSSSPFATATMRRYAADRGQSILSGRFENPPSFTFFDILTCADSDRDYMPDPMDNCSTVSNSNQQDTDYDGVGDVCDLCAGIWDPFSQVDYDNDGAGITCDNCPTVSNPNQRNTDRDGFGDACDNCPNVANDDQADFDRDGIGDVCDPDDDNDGIPDGTDRCPHVASTGNNGDADNDGIGDACDNCPNNSNISQKDSDCDGIGDACDRVSIPPLFGPCGGRPWPIAGDRFWYLKHPEIIIVVRPELVNPEINRLIKQLRQ